MARKKATQEAAAAPPPGVELDHQHTVRWKDRAPETPEPASEPEILSEAEIEEDEYQDQWSEFIDQWGDVPPGWRMQAVRLPDPLPMRELLRKPCFEPMALPRLPFNRDTFIADIQKYAGNSGGYFRVQLSDHMGKYVRGANCTGFIADPPDVPPPQPQPQPAQPQAQTPGLYGMLEKLLVTRMERQLEMLDSPAEPAQAAPSVESQLLELAKNDDSLKHKIIDNYFGKDDEGKSSIIGDILKHPQEAKELLQYGIQLLASVLLARQPVQPGQVPAANGGPHAPALQANPVFAALEPYRALIEAVCVKILNNTEPDEAVMLVEAVKEEKPELAAFIPTIAEMSPVELINLLAGFTANPYLLKVSHASGWVEDFQAKLRGEAEEGEAGE